MTSIQLLILALGSAAGGLVQGITGFAFAMVAMSIWVWAIDPLTAAVMAVFGGLFGQLLSVITVRRGWSWAMLWPFLLGAAVGHVIGKPLVTMLNPTAFKLTLGVMLMLFCSAMLASDRLPRIQTGGRWGDAAAGVLGGIMALLGGFSGLAPALWCTLKGCAKDEQRAIMQNFNLLVLGGTMISLISSGRVHAEMMPAMGLVAAALIGPSIWGAKLYIGMSPQTFRKVVLWVLVLAGAMILIRECAHLLNNQTLSA